jgi:hypothetical protein
MPRIQPSDGMGIALAVVGSGVALAGLGLVLAGEVATGLAVMAVCVTGVVQVIAELWRGRRDR